MGGITFFKLELKRKQKERKIFILASRSKLFSPFVLLLFSLDNKKIHHHFCFFSSVLSFLASKWTARVLDYPQNG